MGILFLVVSDAMSKNLPSIQEAVLWFTDGLAVATIYENHSLHPRKRRVEGEKEKDFSTFIPTLHESKYFFVETHCISLAG